MANKLSQSFSIKVETGRAPSRQQISTSKGKIQSFRKWAFANFLFLLVSFPSDTGHAPSLQKYKHTVVYTKMQFFDCLHATNPFCEP